MILVVDTNIIFSTLLNPHSKIGEVFMNLQDEFTFYAPDLLRWELEKYRSKIAAYSKLDQDSLSDIEKLVLSQIRFVSEGSISEKSWIKAFDLTKNIDENDTPFIALALEINTKVWTGDKVLSQGLEKKGSKITITTEELKKLIG